DDAAAAHAAVAAGARGDRLVDPVAVDSGPQAALVPEHAAADRGRAAPVWWPSVRPAAAERRRAAADRRPDADDRREGRDRAGGAVHRDDRRADRAGPAAEVGRRAIADDSR